jgi:uncharacterized membrane protein YhaH (DUF805 family)
MDEQNGSGFLVARELANRKPFWPLAVIFLALACLLNFHFSTVNQIPSDGPLTRGFPLTFYWMVCPMSAAAAAACRSGTSVLGLIVDCIVCMVCALAAAMVSIHIAGKRFVRRKRFWIITGVVFAATFLLSSLITAFLSAHHHGRGLEIGFPTVYLYEYAGDSLNAVNLAVDLGVCLTVALLCAAAFSREEGES